MDVKVHCTTGEPRLSVGNLHVEMTMCYHHVIIIGNGLKLHCFIYFAREKHRQAILSLLCPSDVLELHFREEACEPKAVPTFSPSPLKPIVDVL
jgi:hypothetical protein